ncbi:MAG: phage virion morphogenesis protein [Desulfobulbaceae bacterium]|nr:phage virion morphogenesis protein [Desulfobulbaceae bacterium]
MAGSAIEFKVDSRDVMQNLGAMIQRIEHPKDAYEIIGEIATVSILRNFEVGGRPQAWEPLKQVTLDQKNGSKILMEQGMAGGLAGSINYKAKSDKVLIGTNKKYGAIHQFGGQAGRGKKVTIPARPYLVLQDEDWTEMAEALKDYILHG